MKIVARVASLASLVGIAAFALALRSSVVDGESDVRMSRADEKPEAVVDAQGNLRVPSSYHADYEFLGTWAIAADKGVGSKELHNVYARPGTIAEYHTRGRFPDGTVLVKEVYETSTAPMTTGTVSHAQTLKGWFVMVKDSNNSHPGNSLWGDGWAWSCSTREIRRKQRQPITKETVSPATYPPGPRTGSIRPGIQRSSRRREGWHR